MDIPNGYTQWIYPMDICTHDIPIGCCKPPLHWMKPSHPAAQDSINLFPDFNDARLEGWNGGTIHLPSESVFQWGSESENHHVFHVYLTVKPIETPFFSPTLGWLIYVNDLMWALWIPTDTKKLDQDATNSCDELRRNPMAYTPPHGRENSPKESRGHVPSTKTI